jgi:feruloyl-CoA synthase
MTAISLLASDTIVTRGDGGAIYARCPHPLGRYPRAITERLEHWATDAPDRTFLARRDNPDNGAWRTLTYAEARRRVRAISQALLARRLAPGDTVAIVSGNSLEHALLALACLHVGVTYAPVAPSYSLLARDYTTLRALWASLQPRLVFAADADAYGPALAAVLRGSEEVITCTAGTDWTPFTDLEAAAPTAEVDEVHARVGPDTIAKILYTSGSTGTPKGVINTQRMLCSNQEMLCTVMPFLRDEPPVLCDWLPWNHTFGGNHNVGIVLYNGGTLYIDDGKPTPAAFETTVANLKTVAPTAYFNVPRGYDLLVPRLAAEPDFAAHFFSRLRMLFCAAASLRQQVADALEATARAARGARIPLVTGLGATESAPFAICAGDSTFTGGRIGVPAPGVELKLAPAGDKLEGRLRGPNITPGYWRNPDLTAAAVDDEGFYKLGDALGFVDAADLSKGFTFEGRLSEDFKLATGTWVHVGPLRARLLAHLGDLAHDAVITGHDRAFVGALIFPNLDGCRGAYGPHADRVEPGRLLAHPRVLDRFSAILRQLADDSVSSSTTVVRAILLDEPPSIDGQETTEKGSVNQRAVLTRRAALVEQLYGADGSAPLIDLSERLSREPSSH